MAKVTNNSGARAIALHIPATGYVEIGRGESVEIDDKDWASLKKLPTIAAHIDDGDLVEEAAAEKPKGKKATAADEKKD